jgi:protein-S-isoprenylcysteine O-methyltransferase Ste14
MSLTEKWVDTILRIATGSSLRRNLMTPFGFLIFVSFVTALIFFSFYIDSLLNFSTAIFQPIILIIGLPLLIAGILLDCICIFCFIKSKGTPVPLNPPKKIVTEGPYAYSRNPMLTGLFFQLFGFGILTSSVSLTFIITPLFILLNIIELKKIEEPELEKRLGNEYIEYRKRVPMFIPRLKKAE